MVSRSLSPTVKWQHFFRFFRANLAIVSWKCLPRALASTLSTAWTVATAWVRRMKVLSTKSRLGICSGSAACRTATNSHSRLKSPVPSVGCCIRLSATLPTQINSGNAPESSATLYGSSRPHISIKMLFLMLWWGVIVRPDHPDRSEHRMAPSTHSLQVLLP